MKLEPALTGLLAEMRNPEWTPNPDLFASPPGQGDIHPDILRTVDICSTARIGEHPFFDLCRINERALRLWVSQEFWISSLFSQALALWLSSIHNAHVRAMASDVYTGEHHEVSAGGVANRAHPVLAAKMCRDLGIDLRKTRPLVMACDFNESLAMAACRTMYGGGFLGIGNELMLLDEYGSIMDAMKGSAPNIAAIPRDFLEENIHDDKFHHVELQQAASLLAHFGYRIQEFVDGATDGVAARVRYYDDLLSYANSET